MIKTLGFAARCSQFNYRTACPTATWAQTNGFGMELEPQTEYGGDADRDGDGATHAPTPYHMHNDMWHQTVRIETKLAQRYATKNEPHAQRGLA